MKWLWSLIKTSSLNYLHKSISTIGELILYTEWARHTTNFINQHSYSHKKKTRRDFRNHLCCCYYYHHDPSMEKCSCHDITFLAYLMESIEPLLAPPSPLWFELFSFLIYCSRLLLWSLLFPTCCDILFTVVYLTSPSLCGSFGTFFF